MKFGMICFSYFFSFSVNALTFQDAVKVLRSHESIQVLDLKSKAIKEGSRLKGSWGDPKLKISAKNFPSDTLKDDQTPMTGIEFGISQKIALTTKYRNLKTSAEFLSSSVDFQAKDQFEVLLKEFWSLLIENRKIGREHRILNENLQWLDKILKVSKRLYSTGKISQQAILDIQIRRSEVESLINNKKFEKSQVLDQLMFFIGTADFDFNTVPWKELEEVHQSGEKLSEDNKELALKKILKAKESKLSAARLGYIPDVTFSVGYTKRSDIDGNGDFVGASIMIPLPFSSVKYSQHGQATEEKYAAMKNLKYYNKKKKRDSALLDKEIQKVDRELSILDTKMIKFANNSREITAKSYGLGNSTYVELLQSELKLQKILMQKVMLEAKRDMKRVVLKYVKGVSLEN